MTNEIVEETVEEEVVLAEPVIVVGDVEYNLVKTGRAQAQQVAELLGWLARYGTGSVRGLTEQQSEARDGLGFIISFLGGLSADALLDLFRLLIGCPKEVAESYFDIAVLIDAATIVYNNQPSFKRVLDRFFG